MDADLGLCGMGLASLAAHFSIGVGTADLHWWRPSYHRRTIRGAAGSGHTSIRGALGIPSWKQSRHALGARVIVHHPRCIHLTIVWDVGILDVELHEPHVLRSLQNVSIERSLKFQVAVVHWLGVHVGDLKDLPQTVDEHHAGRSIIAHTIRNTMSVCEDEGEELAASTTVRSVVRKVPYVKKTALADGDLFGISWNITKIGESYLHCTIEFVTELRRRHFEVGDLIGFAICTQST